MEVMVVVAIVAILASLAAPSFMGLLASNAVSSAGNAFIADARFARGEAQRRGKSITMCRSNAPQAVTPACSAGDGSAVGGWMEGWIVFLDNDGDGNFDADDIVLRVQDQLTNLGDFYAVNAAPLITPVNNRNRITFDGTGRAVGQQGRWIVHAAGALQNDPNYARTLCMNSVGRVRLVKGETACS